MKIVIEIPEEMYQTIKNGHIPFSVLDAIMKGTPLPKGHGRLIDADAINIHDVSPAYGMEVYGATQEDIEDTPTIIKADRKVEEDDDE